MPNNYQDYISQMWNVPGNGNPGTAYNQSPAPQFRYGYSPDSQGGYAFYGGQNANLGRYRPPTLAGGGQDPTQWNDYGGYAYNLPNNYGPFSNFSNFGQGSAGGRMSPLPWFQGGGNPMGGFGPPRMGGGYGWGGYGGGGYGGGGGSYGTEGSYGPQDPSAQWSAPGQDGGGQMQPQFMQVLQQWMQQQQQGAGGGTGNPRFDLWNRGGMGVGDMQQRNTQGRTRDINAGSPTGTGLPPPSPAVPNFTVGGFGPSQGSDSGQTSTATPTGTRRHYPIPSGRFTGGLPRWYNR